MIKKNYPFVSVRRKDKNNIYLNKRIINFEFVAHLNVCKTCFQVLIHIRQNSQKAGTMGCIEKKAYQFNITIIPIILTYRCQ